MRENTKLSRRIDSIRRSRSGSRRVSSGGGEHIVQSGDSLSSIAQMYGITVDSIVSANDLDDPDSIYIGQVLIIEE